VSPSQKMQQINGEALLNYLSNYFAVLEKTKRPELLQPGLPAGRQAVAVHLLQFNRSYYAGTSSRCLHAAITLGSPETHSSKQEQHSNDLSYAMTIKNQ
jgi:hypothetical protein